MSPGHPAYLGRPPCFAAGIRLVGTISYSDRRENDYQDLSLGMIQRLGYDWDNISNNYALAVRIADIALLYVMLALGLNIVVGYAGLLDLGYVAFYAVGAYIFGLLASGHLTETFPAIA